MINDKCFIVAGGPSLKDFDWTNLDNKFIIAINRSYEILPNAEVVYFTDEGFWKQHKQQLLKHSGKLIRGVLVAGQTQEQRVEEYVFTGSEGFEIEPGKLKSGNNSTYAAINLAFHLGFKKIYLLGVDMKWGEKHNRETSHWHDGHTHYKEPESSFSLFLQRFNTIVPHLTQHGIHVINVNPDSALNTFEKKSFEEVFGNE